MKIGLYSIIALFLLSACATTSDDSSRYSKPVNSGSYLQQLMGPKFSGDALEAEITKAQAFPLGSIKNPVRVWMPQGQQAYLNRLNCKNGQSPKYSRDGSFGAGPYGSIIDRYTLKCIGQDDTKVFMDMYHIDHQENKAVPNFTIVDMDSITT